MPPLSAALRADLAERNAAHAPEFYLKVTEAQVQDLASGYVPQVVQAMARTLLDFEDADRRRAERPVHLKPVRSHRKKAR